MSQKSKKQETTNEELTYEKAVSRIEEISKLLESGKVSIDDSLDLFKESIDLIAFCEKKLKEAEQQIITITGEESK